MSQRLGILFATIASLLAAVIASPALAQGPTDLSKVIPDVLGKEERADARGMIDRDIQRRMKDFNVQHRDTWYCRFQLTTFASVTLETKGVTTRLSDFHFSDQRSDETAHRTH